MSERCYRVNTSDCACLNGVTALVPGTAHVWTVLQSQYQVLRMSERCYRVSTRDCACLSGVTESVPATAHGWNWFICLLSKLADSWQGILHRQWKSSRVKDNTKTILGEQYRSLSSSLCSFLHSPITSSLLGPNIPHNTLFSNTLSLRSSLNASDQASKCTWNT